MRRRLSELGEVLLGATWWGGANLVGVLIGAMLILAPLLLANLVAELVDPVPASLALGVGVVGAYAFGLPPWDGDESVGLLLVIGGVAVSVVAWDVIRGGADAGLLLLLLAVTVVGWPIRRAVTRTLDRRA